MKKFTFFLAVTGWTLGLIVHLLSLSHYDVTDKLPYVWVLHIGIFAVWIPAVFAMKNNEELKKYEESGNRKIFGFFRIMFSQIPVWLRIIAIVSFFYALVNFILAFVFKDGTPALADGQFILENHGRFVRTISEQEYHHYRANQVRGFSGHWLAFYGVAAAILYPFNRKKSTIQ